jgi:hypothetical protein
VKGVIFPLCAVASWLVLAGRIQVLRRNWRDPAQVTLAAMVALLGVAFTAAVPPISAGLDRLVGIPNLAAFCIHVAAVASSFAVQILLLYWVCPPELAWQRARWRLVGLAAVLGVMTVLFIAAGVRERAPHFLLQNADHPLVASYMLFYSGALTTGLVANAQICWRYAKAVGSPWLRCGLRITAIGATVTLGYCAARITDVVAVQFGADPAGWEFLVPLCAGVGTLLSFLGLTLPAWGPGVGRRLAQYRDHRRLHPLWFELYRAVPEIALRPPLPWLVERLAVRELEIRLYRRVIEIRDARLALRPWFDPAVRAAAHERGRAAGLDGDALAAAVEAHQLAAALRARAAGDPEHTSAAASPPDQGGSDVAGEISWLVQVARAFERGTPEGAQTF